MNKRIVGCLFVSALAIQIMAQKSGTLSPYSQYGLGVLSDQSLGSTRGMGGLGIGIRNSRQINMQNPASYSAVDSLTMMIDMGLSTKITNFKEGGKSVNARTGNFDYIVASFRLLKDVGMSVGFVPFSNIGYEYESVNEKTSTTESYYGSGGISQVFVGLGWRFARDFSVGINAGYLWGSFDKIVSVTNSDANVNTLLRTYSSTIRSYKLDFGVQWHHQFKEDDLLTLGMTAGIGHKMSATSNVQTVTTNLQTNVTNTPNVIEVNDAYTLPWSFGAGASLVHQKKLTVGADYTLQRWGSIDYPVYDRRGYTMTSNYYRDRHKASAGLDWVPNPVSRRFFSRVHYRLGASYATPYYKINGSDGPSELSVTAGLGLPISRSMVQISGQWVRSSASGFVTENMFRINVGLTFNERWFAKWKVD